MHKGNFNISESIGGGELDAYRFLLKSCVSHSMQTAASMTIA